MDLTEEFVFVSRSLTRRTKLHHGVEFLHGSALALPFGTANFDRVYTIHAGMNIADKPGFFREVRRVLKPEGLFAIFDLMRTAEGPIRYPVPWALTEETSFVTHVNDYREHAHRYRIPSHSRASSRRLCPGVHEAHDGAGGSERASCAWFAFADG